jgi:hypothetical protein
VCAFISSLAAEERCASPAKKRMRGQETERERDERKRRKIEMREKETREKETIKRGERREN